MYSVYLWGSRGSVLKFEENDDVIMVRVISAKAATSLGGLSLRGLKGWIKVDDKLHDGNCRILESNIKSHSKVSCIPDFNIQRHIEQQCCRKDMILLGDPTSVLYACDWKISLQIFKKLLLL